MGTWVLYGDREDAGEGVKKNQASLDGCRRLPLSESLSRLPCLPFAGHFDCDAKILDRGPASGLGVQVLLGRRTKKK